MAEFATCMIIELRQKAPALLCCTAAAVIAALTCVARYTHHMNTAPC